MVGSIKLPRKTKPGKGDLPETEKEWIDYVNDSHDVVMAQRRDYERQWVINLAMYLGHQNLIYNRTSGIIDFERDHTVPLIANRIGSFLESRVSKLTKNRPISRVLPNTNDNADVKASKYSDRLLTYLWQSIGMETELTKAVIFELICGVSFMKTLWDPEAGSPIVRNKMEQTDTEDIIYLDEQGGPLEETIFQGDVNSRAMSAFSLLVPNESIGKLEDQPWTIERLFMPIIDIEGKWPHLQGKISSESNSATRSEFERLVSSLSSTLIPSSSQKNYLRKADSTCQEGLVKIMHMKPNWQYENGVVVAVINKELAMISEFPNDYGKAVYPYVKFQERDDGFHFWQQSTIERLIPIQKAMNRLKEQKAMNAALMANVKWLVPKGAGLHDMALDDTAGEIIEWNSAVPAPRAIEITPLPNYISNFEEELKVDFRDVSGQLETSVSPPPQLTAGVALQAFSEMAEESLIPIIRSLGIALEKVANTQLMIVNDEYLERRKIKIIGNEGTTAVDYLNAADLRNHTDVHIEIESMIPSLRSQKTQRLFDLWDRRIITDPTDFLEMLRYGNFDAAVDKREAISEQIARDIEGMKKGRMTEVSQFQNHIQYVQKLSEFLQTNEFAQLQPDRKELITQAIQQHLQFLIPSMPGGGAEQTQQNQASVGSEFGAITPAGAPGGGR